MRGPIIAADTDRAWARASGPLKRWSPRKAGRIGPPVMPMSPVANRDYDTDQGGAVGDSPQCRHRARTGEKIGDRLGNAIDRGSQN